MSENLVKNWQAVIVTLQKCANFEHFICTMSSKLRKIAKLSGPQNNSAHIGIKLSGRFSLMDADIMILRVNN